MSAPSPGTPTAFRLARITALVLGSLVFLHACERSKSAVLSDVWGEVAVAAAFVAAALGAAWFEIKLRAQEREADTARRRAGSGWDDGAEQAEAPMRGNFSRRGRRSGDEEYPGDEPGERIGRAARPVPMAPLRADDQSEPAEYSARPDLIAGIARTLRIGRSGAEDERPLLSTWNAVTKWTRREPDEDADLEEHDEIEQITRTEAGELVIESSTRTIRVKIARSGDLVVHGRATSGPHRRSEWRWSFQPDVFPGIRAALGDRSGDLLDLLEETIPWLDVGARHDPGAWLRAHDIPATYREKGVSASEVTRELPVLRLGRPPQPPRPGKRHSQSPENAPRTRHPRTASAETPDVRDTRFPARRESPSATARAAGPLPSHRETPSPGGRAADQQSSRRAEGDRRSRRGASRAAEQRKPRPDDDRPSAASRSARRHRGDPDPSGHSDPFRHTAAEDPDLPLRSTPGRPELPRRRRQEPSDEPPADQRHSGRHTPRPSPDPRSDYEADADPSPRESRRQRNPYAATDFDSRPERRNQPERPRRDRSAPADQPPPRRRNGDQQSRRDHPDPSHESTTRRGW
ncbi:hypothetical protein OHA40_25330 [Nocardia sp. NBC_00508]|uniref:hypothetical protein n=1 Tax=Nocardia sp. NBC_00508 TaxID=2975992 RepID=UPI002E8146C6|nr:hypothetical protein [Nocardia sp. NBC_00508]WUD64965.1 hypothetical protein OHA40_25330 [Nocardia sp. NBC_00508]